MALAHLESGHEAFFQQRVRSAGGMVVKLIPVRRGMPDRLVLWPTGRAYLVELKTPEGRLSEIQKHVHAEMAKRGHPVAVLASRGAILHWLRALAQTDDPAGRAPRGRTRRRECQGCGKDVPINVNGQLRAHGCTSLVQ